MNCNAMVSYLGVVGVLEQAFHHISAVKLVQTQAGIQLLKNPQELCFHGNITYLTGNYGRKTTFKGLQKNIQLSGGASYKLAIALIL